MMNRRALLGRALALVAAPALPKVGDLVVYPPAAAEAGVIVKATGIGPTSYMLAAADSRSIPGHTHSNFGASHTHYARP